MGKKVCLDPHRQRRTINHQSMEQIILQEKDDQIAALQKDNKRLQASIESWRDAWYLCRDIIGEAYWKIHQLKTTVAKVF
jgi:hypothetical protein